MSPKVLKNLIDDFNKMQVTDIETSYPFYEVIQFADNSTSEFISIRRLFDDVVFKVGDTLSSGTKIKYLQSNDVGIDLFVTFDNNSGAKITVECFEKWSLKILK